MPVYTSALVTCTPGHPSNAFALAQVASCKTDFIRPSFVAILPTVALRNGDIQEFDSKWDGILSLSMTKFPLDDILESLHKLRIQSDQLQTVLEWYNLEIHQKKAKPDYQRLKTTVK